MPSPIAIYPGSFDPPTFGHINIVERGLEIFKKVVIAVAINTSKRTLLSPEERVSLLRKLFKGKRNVEVDFFEGVPKETVEIIEKAAGAITPKV